jgi:TrmH family RNA methyltransferase
MKSWKDNIYFILVEPKEAGNIGASARALKNMGFKKLELVKPPDFRNDDAKSMACRGIDILEQARVYSGFKEAIKDKQLVVGTTRRFGRTRGLFFPLREASKRIIRAAKKNQVAILFGREKDGLINQEVEECGFLVTIPSNPLFPSLNLAQSVMLVAYELSQKSYKQEAPEFVKHKEIDKLYQRIHSTLRLLEYVPRGDKDLEAKIMLNLKHLLGRAGLTDWELNMLYGICSRIEKKLRQAEE